MQHLLTLHAPQAARDYYLAGTWRNETMYDALRAHARLRGNCHALRDGQRRLTWRQLLVWVDAIAHDLQVAGLVAGDRVSVWLPSRAEVMAIFLACSRNGYVCSPSLHQNYTVAEIMALVERVSSKAFFAQAGHGADAAQHDVFEAIRAVGSLRRVYRLDAQAEEARVSGTFAMPDAGGPQTLDMPSANADQIVYIAFTSGTTGPPKGVMHSDNTLMANGRAMVADWHQDDNTVLLSLSPASHHIATVALEQALAAGCELVLFPAERDALDWITETGATYVMGVPTHAMDLLASARRRGARQLGAVRVFYMAGAPIPRETAEQFIRFGVTPQNVYGMTENGSHQYTLPHDAVETITATCGRACSGYEVRLWNPELPDEEVLPGSVGEIGGRGAQLMLGYFGNQATTEASFNSSGWFLSGDLGMLDSGGNLRIVGRKKDLIIRGGHNIHPAHIEDLAHRHPQVAKAAAFGIADNRLGEKVCLAILADGDDAPTGDALLEHLHAQGLSKFDMPEYFIVLERFPLTPSGKILKRELAAQARNGQLAPQPVRWTSKPAAQEQ
ncbi:MAG: class I adenylate-forming enzyme family protein [Pseudomonadota bacterium]